MRAIQSENRKEEGMSASLACFTDSGGVRKSNQDAFIITDLTEAESVSSPGELLKRPVGPHGLLLAVADAGAARKRETSSFFMRSELITLSRS